MDANKLTATAAVIAALASAYSAYSSSSASRDAAIAAGNSAVQVAEMNKQNMDRVSDIEMVKLALNILGGEISDKTQQSRAFALSLLQKYSGVELTEEQAAQWRSTGTVGWLDSNAGLAASWRYYLDRSKLDPTRDYMQAPYSKP